MLIELLLAGVVSNSQIQLTPGREYFSIENAIGTDSNIATLQGTLRIENTATGKLSLSDPPCGTEEGKKAQKCINWVVVSCPVVPEYWPPGIAIAPHALPITSMKPFGCQ